jgi:predicted porin
LLVVGGEWNDAVSPQSIKNNDAHMDLRLKERNHMMKKILAAGTISALGAVLPLQAVLADEVSVYGKFNMSYGFNTEDNATGFTVRDNYELESHASRLGVKGSHALSDSLKMIYTMEFGVTTDNNDGDTFNQRNIFLGAQGNWGTFLAGRYDSALKKIQYSPAGSIDLFDDNDYGDYDSTFIGDDRLNNNLVYATPAMGGFSAMIQFQPGEDSGAKGDDKDSGAIDSFSGSVAYDMDKDLHVALAYNNNINNADTIRLAAKWNIGMIALGAMMQQAEENQKDGGVGCNAGGNLCDTLGAVKKQSSYLGSVGFTLDKLVLKAQMSQGKHELVSGASDVKITNYGLGADYNIDPANTAYVFIAQAVSDEKASNGKDDGANTAVRAGYIFKF